MECHHCHHLHLNVPPYRQSPAHCGPASLLMIAAYHGIATTEARLAKLAGTTYRFGTTAQGLVKAANKIGLKGKIKDFSTLEDIERFVNKRQLPVIVDWFSEDDGHYSVVIGIDKHHIHLLDPELAAIRSMPREDFFRVWFDFRGPYLKNKTAIVIRRLIIIEP